MRTTRSNGNVQPSIDQLLEEHRRLEARIAEIEKQASFSVEDEAEIRRLKKMKLRKKDAIEALRRQAVS